LGTGYVSIWPSFFAGKFSGLKRIWNKEDEAGEFSFHRISAFVCANLNALPTAPISLYNGYRRAG